MHQSILLDAFKLTPGSQQRYHSWNTTYFTSTAVATTYTAFVLNSSYFQFVTNISRIEFVPVTVGSLVIEVILPLHF